jgi:signal transduction histidine kinase
MQDYASTKEVVLDTNSSGSAVASGPGSGSGSASGAGSGSGSEIAMVADEERLIQVLANLVSNAIKFSPPCKPVKIWVEKSDKGTTFNVKDEGPGIPSHLQSVIFERYRQVDDTQRRRGFGLGLFICKGIVEAHHGTISVNSEEGRGSTFSFFIPNPELPFDWIEASLH